MTKGIAPGSSVYQPRKGSLPCGEVYFLGLCSAAFALTFMFGFPAYAEMPPKPILNQATVPEEAPILQPLPSDPPGLAPKPTPYQGTVPEEAPILQPVPTDPPYLAPNPTPYPGVVPEEARGKAAHSPEGTSQQR